MSVGANFGLAPTRGRCGCGPSVETSSTFRSIAGSRPRGITEQRVLDHVIGPALDIGCGPGRHLVALAERRVFALGIDISGPLLGRTRPTASSSAATCGVRSSSRSPSSERDEAARQ